MKNLINISISSFLMMCFSVTSLNIAVEVIEYSDSETQSSYIQGSDDVVSSSNKYEPNQNVFLISKANSEIETSSYVQELKYVNAISFIAAHAKAIHGIRGPPQA